MTESRACVLAIVVLTLASISVAQEASHVAVLPDGVKWGPASPKLPPGAQFAVLAGDPTRPGAAYVFRAKLPDGYSVPPHWHPMDENVTVIKGVFALGFGDRFDRSALRELPVGSYAMLPKKLPHYNVMKGETILQFHGIGPYDINYVNPADDPSRKPVVGSFEKSESNVLSSFALRSSGPWQRQIAAENLLNHMRACSAAFFPYPRATLKAPHRESGPAAVAEASDARLDRRLASRRPSGLVD